MIAAGASQLSGSTIPGTVSAPPPEILLEAGNLDISFDTYGQPNGVVEN